MSSHTERLLLETIEEQTDLTGLKVDMGGGGGYKTGHDAGDIIVGRAVYQRDKHHKTYSELYIIEEKYKATDANPYLQEKQQKFDDFIEMAEAWGATPVLAVRWSSRLEWSPGAKHLLCDAREVRRTKSGNVNVKPETAEEEYLTVQNFFDRG